MAGRSGLTELKELMEAAQAKEDYLRRSRGMMSYMASVVGQEEYKPSSINVLWCHFVFMLVALRRCFVCALMFALCVVCIVMWRLIVCSLFRQMWLTTDYLAVRLCEEKLLDELLGDPHIHIEVCDIAFCCVCVRQQLVNYHDCWGACDAMQLCL